MLTATAPAEPASAPKKKRFHERKRDWPMTTYKFWAIPDTLPESFWAQAKAMQTLWNTLVSLGDTASQETRALLETLPNVHAAREAAKRTKVVLDEAKAAAKAINIARRSKKHPDSLAARAHIATCRETHRTAITHRRDVTQAAKAAMDSGLRERQQAVWAHHDTACLASIQTAIKSRALAWDAAEAVLQRYKTTRSVAAKGQRGWPKPHHALQDIAIPIRFTSGGAPVSRIFSTNHSDLRLRLAPVPTSAYASNSRADQRTRYTRGEIRLGPVSFAFRTILHRPIPRSAFLKQAQWLGHHRPSASHPWTWALALTLELPPTLPTGTGTRVAGLDLGWRHLDHATATDKIRVATLVADDATTECIELPLRNLATKQQLRRHERYTDWPDLLELDRETCAVTDACKANLAPLLADPSAPTPLTEVAPHLTQMRDGGLRKLLRAWQDLPKPWAPPVQQAHTLLLEWKPATDRLRSIKDRLTTRLIGRRNTFYAQTALRLCRTYQVIAWEGDLDLKDMAQKQEDEKALEASKRYRQRAALYKFRQYLRQAAAKTGTTLLDCPAAMTTITCHQCGGIVRNTGDLILTCGNCGSAWDQDVNAARNLLAQIPKA